MAELIDRMAVEQAFANRLGLWTTRHKQELENLLGTPPDWSKVTDDFWNRVEEEMKTELAIILLLIFSASARQHGSALASGDVFAVARSSEVSKSFVGNSRARFDSIRQRAIEYKTRNPQGSIASLPDAKDVASEIFSPDRLNTLVVTETTVAQSAGGEAATRDRGEVSQQDAWYTEKDGRVCKTCGPLHASLRGAWMQAFPGGPPAHPNCRCWIKYAGVPAAMETV